MTNVLIIQKIRTSWLFRAIFFLSTYKWNEENLECLPNLWNKKSCQNGRVVDYFHGRFATLITSWNTQLVGSDKMSQRTSTERTKSGGNNITCNTFCSRIIINQVLKACSSFDIAHRMLRKYAVFILAKFQMRFVKID